MSDHDTPTGPDEETGDRPRLRRRSVRAKADRAAPPEATETTDEETAADAEADPADRASSRSGRTRGRRRPSIANPFAIDPSADEDPTDEIPVVGDLPVADAEEVASGEEESGRDAAADDDAADEAADETPSASASASADDEEEEAAPRKRRRRGGRGRRGRGRGEPDDEQGGDDQSRDDEQGGDDEEGGDERPADEADEAADGADAGNAGVAEDEVRTDGAGDEDDEDDERSGSGRRRRRGRRGRGRRSSGGGKGEGRESSSSSSEIAAGSTRISARAPRTPGGRRRIPTVSPETRRAIAESPPKRMLVTVGAERTQIAVLEERSLVEHYVTQASEASYVGNIYKGRVQNVLPGMEAAFVDIGKGRNGVLYAGEVNYDEADRDGGLPRIEQALKPGQTVMVQVTKDPMGTKGARLTQHLSLAGRYCVLAPGDDMLGISRKLPDDQRERLRKILKGLKPEGYGLIVRTAAETATAEQLEADVKRLIERWQRVEERAAAAKVLEPVYAEPQLVLRVIRDVFGPEHTQLVIDDAELADQVRDYLQEVSPEHVDKVAHYEGEGKVFDAYEVTVQIRRALEKKVWLKSGGYLIIEKTEAMWVIDVNTGKFVGKDNLEETVLRNNIEAAEEIAKQLRLRDMGGIIVIDFVDMIVPANRDEVLKRFKRELARDKTKSRVMEISKLGLVQMTRKNVSKGLMESFTEETDDAIPGRRIVEDLLA
ncbi:hypothetical protein BH23ACT9_BH23ACT9_23970 [soil metagenome]